MPRGAHPTAYFDCAHVDKPLEEIYQDIDSFTDEVFADDINRHSELSVFFLLPPLRYRGIFLKGILFTHGADLLIERNPQIKRLFHVFAYSMYSSVPSSTEADGLFCLYDNTRREHWFKNRYPERAHQIWLPLEDADFFDHYRYAPHNVARDLDILCVSRLDNVKNVPMFIDGLRALRELEPERTYTAALVTGRDIDINLSALNDAEKEIWRKMLAVAPVLQDYVEVSPTRQSDLSAFYSRAKCVVLASLIEGKNRTIHEAASCDAAVVTFEAFNQYGRGGQAAMPDLAGVAAPEYTAESLAKTISSVVNHFEQFRPREAILAVSGKVHVFNTCVDALPYYKQQLPGFHSGEHAGNRWLDLAMVACYGTSVHRHLFGPGQTSVWVKGLTEAEEKVEMFEQACAES